METITKSILKKIYPKREPWVHKGKFGKLAIIGGSRELTGSCCFAGMAAYRAGCDVVYIIAPHRAAGIAAQFSPNLITIPLKCHFFTPDNLNETMAAIHHYGITALVLGPGMGSEDKTIDFVHCLLATITLPTIIDADGIRAFAAAPVAHNKLVFTPHAGEFLALTKKVLPTSFSERATHVAKASQHYKATILAKGHVDIISNGAKTLLNKTGSPFMTKGGMGDTLAGIVGAYLARGINPFHAACAAAYVNGAAGALAAKKLGESTLATDVVNEIQNVL